MLPRIHTLFLLDLSVYWWLYWPHSWWTIDKIIDLLNRSPTLSVRHVNFPCVNTFIGKTCFHVTKQREEKDKLFVTVVENRENFLLFLDCRSEKVYYLNRYIYQGCFFVVQLKVYTQHIMWSHCSANHSDWHIRLHFFSSRLFFFHWIAYNFLELSA